MDIPPIKRRRGRPKSFNDKPAQTTIRALDRALDVLDVLAASQGLSLSEIATRLGQSPATIYRVLSTFQVRDVVEVDPASQLWFVGPTAFRLGASFLRRSDIVERSRPVMRALMEATGETANLGIEKSEKVLFVSQVETHETIRAFFPPGTSSEMHASGIGKALLSQMSETRLSRLLRRASLETYTDNTITTPDGLRQELANIRACGYAFDDEERTPGMRCIAAPIVNFYGEAVAGISVSGPTNRMTIDRINGPVSRLVRDAAAGLSRGLGAPNQIASGRDAD